MKKSDNIPLLEELKLELSYNCNLSCVHCSSEGSQDHRIKISIEKAKEIVKSSKELGVKTISLSGGEPYLWSGLTELANYTTNLGIKLNIYSSGSTNNFSRTTKNIKKDNVKLIFSLHGSNQELHEKISGIKGSFLKTIDSIDEATKLGFSCEVHFVPLRINYFDINSLVNLIKGFGIAKISILRFVPQGRGALNKDLVLTSEEFMTLRKNILHLRESGLLENPIL